MVYTCACVIPGRMRRTFASVTPGCHIQAIRQQKRHGHEEKATPPE